MRQQFCKEWDKFLHAWSVRIVFLLFIAGGILAGMTSGYTGYMAPFRGCRYCGEFTGPLLFAVIVAGQVAREYQNGRAAKAATETKKGQYFGAKVMGLFSLSAFLCLAYTAVVSLLCLVKNGAGSGYFSYYPLQVAVFLVSRVLTYWIYTAVFLLISVLVRRKVWTFLLSFGALWLEIFLWTLQQKRGTTPAAGGPWNATLQYETYLGRANFLSYDYFLLFVPGVYAGVFALVIGFCVYRRGKLQIEPCRKSQRSFAGKTAGLVLLAVLFSFCGRVSVSAEENAVSSDGSQFMENVGELRLVYGDRNLDDSDAFVLFLMAEGFTENEQEDFFRGAENLISELMCVSPYDEFADVTKIYAIGTISAESGSRGDKAGTWEAAEQDSRDTFFGTFFWAGGVARRIGISSEGLLKMAELREQFLPMADFCGVIVNSNVNGGTAYFDCPTGNIILATLRLDKEVLPHELGHAVARLADEYDEEGYTAFFSASNATRQPDPRQVRWTQYIGLDDISVYPFAYNSDWYHPSKVCIMRSEGAGRFCKVCEDALRERIGQYCTGSRLLFGSYGEQIPESKAGTDMREYFSVQQGFGKLKSSQIPEELLLLKYYDGDGMEMDGLPGKPGKYSVEAEFLGYQDKDVVYGPCVLTVFYEIKASSAKVFWLSVTPLLVGGVVWILWLKIFRARNKKYSVDSGVPGMWQKNNR